MTPTDYAASRVLRGAACLLVGEQQGLNSVKWALRGLGWDDARIDAAIARAAEAARRASASEA